MILRNLAHRIQELATRWPVVTITGPRQSGKTTLSQMGFPNHAHVSLESPDIRQFATSDPRGFLREYGDGAVLDEVQRVPELLSYLQAEVDERPDPGRFVLTGSANLSLLESVSQSLAGRTAVLSLLPCSLDELHRFEQPPSGLYTTLWSGAYPAVFDRGIPPQEWFGSYIDTYVERDVRQIQNVGDLGAFQTFLRLCAGRVGQLLNLSNLGADGGISHNTAKAWLSVLETGFIAFRLRPYFRNLGKREIKTPKLYFYDTGLVCALIGIREPEQLRHHPLRGAIFENWVITEVLKARMHRGLSPELYFYRDRKRLEIDLIVDRGDALLAVETKSGATVANDFFKALEHFGERLAETAPPTELTKIVVYGGSELQRRSSFEVMPWSAVQGGSWVR